MKTIRAVAFFWIVVFLFCGCSGRLLDLGTPGQDPDPCAEKPAEEFSWLCEAASASGVRLDALHNLLLDSAAVAVILSDIPRDKVRRYIDRVEKYLDMAELERLTYSWLIGMVTEDASKEAALASILSRRISIFRSSQPISNWDLKLIRLHLRHQRQSLGV